MGFEKVMRCATATIFVATAAILVVTFGAIVWGVWGIVTS